MNTDEVTREHVLSAIDECDELGDVAFLRRYGFSNAREGGVWHTGRSYEAKAMLGVALKFATGRAARPSEIAVDKAGADAILESLDFEPIAIPDSPTPPDESLGPWRDARELGVEPSREAWTVAARELLLETAAHYHAVVSYAELSTLVQTRTGIRTRQQVHHWVGDVLGRVAAECHANGEPLLSSLCVTTSGTVGVGYVASVTKLRGETPEDGDDHAAAERLACHRFFGAELPEDGGVAALTPEVVHQRDRKRSAKPVERPAAICPKCHMALLPTGVCDSCD